MRLRVLAIGCLALLAATAAIAQSGTATKDPVTGKWGSDGLPYLDLTFDGQSKVSGTTIWRMGDGYEHRAAIKAGSFDAKTGVLKLEGEAKGPDGVVRPYAIEGRIEGDTVSGTFKFGDEGGEFTFTRQ
jgi:hypothetical protein